MNEADLYAAAKIEEALRYIKTKYGPYDRGSQVSNMLRDIASFADTLRSNAMKDKMVLVPQKPPEALLISMALRYNHAFGLMDRKSQEVLLTEMKQVHQEVVGTGFYSPDKAQWYLDLLCPEGEERETLEEGTKRLLCDLKARFKIVIDGTTMVIRDIGPWDKYPSVTNDVEAVVKFLNLCNLGDRKLFYYDSEGDLDEIVHDGEGKFIEFRPVE